MLHFVLDHIFASLQILYISILRNKDILDLPETIYLNVN